jgi:nucleoid-associated protein YgaU
MNRYKYQKVKKDSSDGRRKLSTTDYAKVEFTNGDINYRVKYGDSYSTLAHRFYQDQSLWWVIARANSEFEGNIKPKIGKKLVIPKDISSILANLNRDNKMLG